MMKEMICPGCWGGKQHLGVSGMQCDYCHGEGHVADMEMSEYFHLSELLYSNTATRLGIANDPTPPVVAHLQQLVVHLLDPIRESTGTIHVNSAFRAMKLNEAVHSKPTSAHPRGWAADITARGLTRKELVDRIIELKIKFDQVLFEGTWVHVALFKPDDKTQRGEVLSTWDGGKTFQPYDPNDKRFNT